MFVGNLHYDTTREELSALLSAAGQIVDLHLPTDRESGRPRGFAFVGFATEEEAAEAIRRFNQVEMRGRKLNLNPADDRPRRAPGGSPGPGGFAPRPPMMDMGGAGFGGGGGLGGGFGGGAGRRGAPDRRFKSKGSRRGLRGRKRSL